MPYCTIEEAWDVPINPDISNFPKPEIQSIKDDVPLKVLKAKPTNYSRTYNRQNEHSGPTTRLPSNKQQLYIRSNPKNKLDTKIFVWEYEIKKSKEDRHSHKTYVNSIYSGSSEDLLVPEIIEAFSTWNQTDYFKQLPIFEIQSSQNFPMEQTLVPIMKRKLTSYIYQIVNSEKLNNFDFEK